jgi:hypothetical protein
VDEWAYRVSITALAPVCMTRQTSLDRISVADLAAVRGSTRTVADLAAVRGSTRTVAV